MASLFSQNIGLNYKGILNLNTLNGNLTTTLEAITDGDGNASTLLLSTTLARVSSNLTIGGSTTASARLHVRGDGTNPIFRLESSAGTQSTSVNAAGTVYTYGSVGNAMTIINEAASGNITGKALGWSSFIDTLAGFNFRYVAANNHSYTSGTGGFLDIGSVLGTFAAGAGSANFRPLNLAYTINNSGAQTGTATGIFLNATETALNGMTHNLMDLQRGGVSQFLVDRIGIVTAQAFIGTSYIRGRLLSTSGIQLLEDTAGGTFNRLQFGGTTNAFPAIKRNGAAIDFRLADDSGFCNISAGAITTNGLISGNPQSATALAFGAQGNQIGVIGAISSNLWAVGHSTASSSVQNARVSWNTSGVGINTSSINASAALDVTSTTLGFLPPRMTEAQRDLIASPATGLIIYNTTTNVLNFYNGSAWGAV